MNRQKGVAFATPFFFFPSILARLAAAVSRIALRASLDSRCGFGSPSMGEIVMASRKNFGPSFLGPRFSWCHCFLFAGERFASPCTPLDLARLWLQCYMGHRLRGPGRRPGRESCITLSITLNRKRNHYHYHK